MTARVWLMLSLLVSGTTWLYTQRILTPWVGYNDVKKGAMTAELGDLYPRWVGARELLLYGRNPYGPEVTQKIQAAYYGHAVTQESRGATVDEQRFAYPVYVVFLMAPTVYADFAEVHRWAPLLLALLTALHVLFAVAILRWRLRWEALAALVLFTLSSPQIVQGLRFEQLALVVGCLLASGAWCVARNHLAAAGVLLAVSTIKPQLAILPLCCFGIWAAGDWRKRWQLPLTFGVTLAALIGAGEVLLPGWTVDFFAGVAAYRRYFPTSSLLRLALGDTLGEILGGIIVVVLFGFAWRSRKETGDSRQFATVLAAFLIGAILALPLFTPFNQVLLIFPAMLLLQDWEALPRFSRIVFIAVTSWPWIISAALLLFPPRVDSPRQIPLLPSFLVSFVPLLLPLLLMTRRDGSSHGMTA